MEPAISVSKDVTGYVLHETTDVVVIATLESVNEKTGNMIQIWILLREMSPVEGVKTGADAMICFDCPLRGLDGFGERICYVNVAQGPGAVWRSYTAGKYPYLDPKDYARVFGNREVRFGAYGDPVLIPIWIVRPIVRVVRKYTGYSHQWDKPAYQEYRLYFMASADTPVDRENAKALGWRTFRCRTKDGAILPGEITCPASDEAGKKTQCIRCGLCNGRTGATDPRKDIVIIAHGSGSKNFVRIGAIAPLAA